MHQKNEYRTKQSKQERQIVLFLTIFAANMVVFGFLMTPPKEIFAGILTITLEPDRLITDYIALASLGAAFVNAGLVTVISIGLIKSCKIPFTGVSIACCFLMAGFALFGKNIINICPILLGVFIYAKVRREMMDRYIYIALFGTSLSPVISEFRVLFEEASVLQLVAPLFAGVVIGFMLPPVAVHVQRAHMGYNLYNVGFACGLICLIFVSILRSFGTVIEGILIWSTGNNAILSIYLTIVFSAMIVAGFILNGKSFSGIWHITRHSGRAVADFIVLDGLPRTLMNMGLLGLVYTGYVVLVEGSLNGPTIGGILSISGFGAFGKHLKNTFWVVAGVIVASAFMVWSLEQPEVLLAALFSTGLAPVAGQFGPACGLIVGMIHGAVVLNLAELAGGLNLYNNGFAAGLICMVIVPIFESYSRLKEE